jgi:hypothetical protein
MTATAAFPSRSHTISGLVHLPSNEMTIGRSSVDSLRRVSDDRLDGTVLRSPGDYDIVTTSLYLVTMSDNRTS